MSPYMGPNPCPKVIILHLNLFPFGVALKSAYFPGNLILRQTGKGEGNLMFLNQTFLAIICYQNHVYCLSVYFSDREKWKLFDENHANKWYYFLALLGGNSSENSSNEVLVPILMNGVVLAPCLGAHKASAGSPRGSFTTSQIHRPKLFLWLFWKTINDSLN